MCFINMSGMWHNMSLFICNSVSKFLSWKIGSLYWYILHRDIADCKHLLFLRILLILLLHFVLDEKLIQNISNTHYLFHIHYESLETYFVKIFKTCFTLWERESHYSMDDDVLLLKISLCSSNETCLLDFLVIIIKILKKRFLLANKSYVEQMVVSFRNCICSLFNTYIHTHTHIYNIYIVLLIYIFIIMINLTVMFMSIWY